MTETRRFRTVAPLAFALIVASSAFAACSGEGRRSGFGAGQDGGTAEGGIGFGDAGQACRGLECQRAKCDGQPKTTLTGKVFDPAGTVPLYNVVVYIPGGLDPEAPLPPIKSSLDEGVTCEKCSALTLNPLVSTLTNTDGTFTLEDVPVAKNVPIVVQIGKWRRRVTLDIDDACAENKVKDRDVRLPRNGTEGDMPHIAVTAGGYDALECLLLGIGIDESEFVPGADPSGHVHVFKGSGGFGLANAPQAADELWNDTAKMLKYDITMMSCEGGENNQNKGDFSAVHDYANAGGRIFTTHYHYTWFKNSSDDAWKSVANWGSSTVTPGAYDVDMSFPKGEAFAEWLLAINASSTLGSVQLQDVTGSITSVNAPSQSWVQKDPNAVKYFSFNTPLNADEASVCGRAVFSDVHLMGPGAKQFPNDCPGSGGLSAQQKAVEFLFFDLSACVQSDDTPPSPPK